MTDYRIVIQYEDTINKRLITRDDLLRCLDCLDVPYYAFILHDNDYDVGLNLKTKHYHVVIRFAKDLQLRRVITLFSQLLQIPKNLISVQFSNDMIRDVRYLCHLDNCDKSLYDVSSVLSNDCFRTLAILNNDLQNPCLSVFKPIDVNYIINVCANSSTLADVYSCFDLESARKYAYLIKCIWDSSN